MLLLHLRYTYAISSRHRFPLCCGHLEPKYQPISQPETPHGITSFQSSRLIIHAKCKVKCNTRWLAASSVPQSRHGLAGGIVQGHLEFTAWLQMSSQSVSFSLLDRFHKAFFCGKYPMFPLFFHCDCAWWLPLTGLPWIPYTLSLVCSWAAPSFQAPFPKLIYCWSISTCIATLNYFTPVVHSHGENHIFYKTVDPRNTHAVHHLKDIIGGIPYIILTAREEASV